MLKKPTLANALTHDHKDTVMELGKSSEYRINLLGEALDSCLEGDPVLANSLLQDYIKAYEQN